MTATVIYDGECQFCLRCITLLRCLDRHQRVRTVPFQDAAALASLPVSAAQASQAVYLVTEGRSECGAASLCGGGPDEVGGGSARGAAHAGGVYRGAEAVSRTLDLVLGVRVFGFVYRLPGIGRGLERAYAWVARNRSRLGCQS